MRKLLRSAMFGALAAGMLSTSALAQGGPEAPPQPSVPAPGIVLHLQLLEADTSIKTRDPAIMDMAKVSAVMTQCPKREPGEAKPPACGARAPLGYVLLDSQTVTTDAQGHAMQRLALHGGQAVAEISISDLHWVGQQQRVWMRAGFWPRVPTGEAPASSAAMRATLLGSIGHVLDMTLANPHGGLILLIRPELPVR